MTIQPIHHHHFTRRLFSGPTTLAIIRPGEPDRSAHDFFHIQGCADSRCNRVIAHRFSDEERWRFVEVERMVA